MRQPIKTYKYYTGEGFKGERLLASAGLILTIVSTIFLIDLTLKQRKHIKNQMDEFEKTKNN